MGRHYENGDPLSQEDQAFFDAHVESIPTEYFTISNGVLVETDVNGNPIKEEPCAK